MPLLTIVVIPLIGGTALERCLAAAWRLPAAVIVVGPVEAALAGALRERGTTIVNSDAQVPQRRAIGAARVATPWVLFCEDTCHVEDGWWNAFESLAANTGCDAWGGPIEIGTRMSARGTALAALEYGRFRPGQLGPNQVLRPAPHIAGLAPLYRTAALPRPAPPEGLIETELHGAMAAAGRAPAMHGGLLVRYDVDDAHSATLASRFIHGRIYGGGRRALLGPAARAFRTALCLPLPLLLFSRGVLGLPAGRRGDPGCLVWLAALAVSWSAGEAVGMLLGRGRSLSKWYR